MNLDYNYPFPVDFGTTNLAPILTASRTETEFNRWHFDLNGARKGKAVFIGKLVASRFEGFIQFFIPNSCLDEAEFHPVNKEIHLYSSFIGSPSLYSNGTFKFKNVKNNLGQDCSSVVALEIDLFSNHPEARPSLGRLTIDFKTRDRFVAAALANYIIRQPYPFNNDYNPGARYLERAIAAARGAGVRPAVPFYQSAAAPAQQAAQAPTHLTAQPRVYREAEAQAYQATQAQEDPAIQELFQTVVQVEAENQAKLEAQAQAAVQAQAAMLTSFGGWMPNHVPRAAQAYPVAAAAAQAYPVAAAAAQAYPVAAAEASMYPQLGPTGASTASQAIPPQQGTHRISATAAAPGQPPERFVIAEYFQWDSTGTRMRRM